MYYNMLLESCKELAGNPGLGENYSDITPTLMGVKSGRHIIFYRMIGADEIEVVRFLHEQMNLKSKQLDVLL